MKNFVSLSNFAYKNFKTHPFAQEFRTVIIVFIVLRLVTMVLSGFGSYSWYYFNLIQHVQNLVITSIVSILFCCLVEFVVSSFLYKFFKFLLKGRVIWSVMCFIGAALFMSIAFFATTQGLANRQFAKHDNSVLLIENSKLDIENLKKEKELKIIELRKNIELEKSNPQGWINNKRVVLTAEQLETIKLYNQQIFKLEEDYNSLKEKNNIALSDNISKTQSIAKIEAEKYYNIGVVIIVFQIITALGIAFFFSRIYNEIATEDEKADEKVKSLFDIVETFIDSITKNQITNKFAVYANKLQHLSEHYQAKTIELPLTNVQIVNSNQKQDEKQTKKDDTKIIGFNSNKQNQSDSNNINENRNNDNRNNDNRSNENKLINLPICKFCGKPFLPNHHKQLYCDDNCKIPAWEKKTGKKYIKKPKKIK